MKTISTNALWVWAIFDGIRPIENRKFLTLHRGPILIHASASMRETPLIREWIRRETLYLPPPDELLEREFVGRVVGQIDLIGCVAFDDLPKTEREFAAGPYCMRLRDPQPFNHPFPMPDCRDWSDVPISPSLST